MRKGLSFLRLREPLWTDFRAPTGHASGKPLFFREICRGLRFEEKSVHVPVCLALSLAVQQRSDFGQYPVLKTRILQHVAPRFRDRRL